MTAAGDTPVGAAGGHALVTEWEAIGIVRHSVTILGPSSRSSSWSAICACGWQDGAYISRLLIEKAVGRHHQQTAAAASYADEVRDHLRNVGPSEVLDPPVDAARSEGSDG